MNNHVAEPFRSIVDSMIDPLSDNTFDLHTRIERLTINVARKRMGNDVLRVMLEAQALGAQAQVEAVISFCDAEAKK